MGPSGLHRVSRRHKKNHQLPIFDSPRGIGGATTGSFEATRRGGEAGRRPYALRASSDGGNGMREMPRTRANARSGVVVGPKIPPTCVGGCWWAAFADVVRK
jgi:hypothetical protein